MLGIVIGGGIGGLCAAGALRRVGIDVRVYEAAASPTPVGAGIMIAPNAMSVFDHLGIADDVQSSGTALESLVVCDQRGRVLQSLDGRLVQRWFGHPVAAIHRAELHRILLEQLDDGAVRFGRRCVSCHQTEKQAVVRFKDGSEDTADFLIGADGLRSVVRQHLVPAARLRYTGQTCWRGVTTAATLPGLANAELWGRGRRVGYLPIGRSKVYWYAAANREAGGTDDDDPRPALLDLFSGFADPVAGLIGQTPPELIVRHDLYDLRPMTAWSVGRLTLLGDAAHAPTPDLGQGGAQAVEDAWVLAAELKGTADSVPAFRRYEQRRLGRANRVVRESRRFGRVAGLEHPALCALRNLIVRRTPGFITRRQLTSLFTPQT